jgi:hypothetical protein
MIDWKKHAECLYQDHYRGNCDEDRVEMIAEGERLQQIETAYRGTLGELNMVIDENTRLREALEEIARPGYGLELNDTDEERADYWASATKWCRERARAALSGK